MIIGRPLSAGQRALWFLHRLAPDTAAYNVVAAIRIRTVLEVDRLAEAVRVVAGRHELVRSVLTEVDGEPRRLVHGPGALHLEVREAAGAGQIEEVARAPFRLADGEPPARLVLLRRSADDAVLVFVAHHIVTDATSHWLFLGDLFEEYGEPGADRPPVAAYDDVVDAEQRLLASAEGARLAEYWHALCGDAVAAELPTDLPRPERPAFGGATRKLTFGEGTDARLREAAAAAGVTPFGFLLGVFNALLHRYSGQDDLAVGCAAVTRRGRAQRRLFGYLVNPIVVRARFTRLTTFEDAVRAANAGVVDGLRHAGHPFPVLVQELNLPRAGNRTPLFQITFSMLEPSPLAPLSALLPGAAEEGPELDFAGLRLTQLEIPQMEGQFDLNVEMRLRDGELTAVFRYDTGLFEEPTVDRLARSYERLVNLAVSAPRTPVAAASLLDGRDFSQVLAFGSGSGA